ncbi:MAG: hypothetical protein ACQEVQ_06610 [Pseudomonadota bacterium]|jgi:hypothetical protein
MALNQARNASTRKAAGLRMLHAAVARAKQEGRVRTKTRASIK